MDTKKNLLYTALGIIVVIVIGLLIWWAAADTDDPDTASLVRDEYATKVVYADRDDLDIAALRADCRERGGTFNECGTPCPPEAEVCAEVCAYTCELAGDGAEETGVRLQSPQANATVTSPLTVTGTARGSWFFEGVMPVRLVSTTGTLIAQASATSTENWMTEEYIPFTATLTFAVDTEQAAELVIAKDNPSGLPENAGEVRIPVTLAPGDTATTTPFSWETYTNATVGFTIEHPQDATVSDRNDDHVSFLYTGPTQAEGTEVYDGILFSVTLLAAATTTPLAEYAAAFAQDSLGPDGRVTQPVAPASLGGQTAYRWQAEGLGTFTHYLAADPDRTDRLYHIAFTAPDPADRGYAAAVRRMLDSFAFQP